jgi:hypothetical protein
MYKTGFIRYGTARCLSVLRINTRTYVPHLYMLHFTPRIKQLKAFMFSFPLSRSRQRLNVSIYKHPASNKSFVSNVQLRLEITTSCLSRRQLSWMGPVSTELRCAPQIRPETPGERLTAWGSGGIAPLIPSLGTRSSCGLLGAPSALPPGGKRWRYALDKRLTFT